MTEQELQARGNSGLLRQLREREREIIRLNGESRKLRQRMESLLSSMNAVSAGSEVAANLAAAGGPPPEEYAPPQPEDDSPGRAPDSEIAQLREETRELRRRLDELLPLTESRRASARPRKVKPRRVNRP